MAQRRHRRGWTPLRIPGLIRYYSARYTQGFADGDLISSLPELVGGVATLTKIGGLDANRPTFKKDIVRGLPAIFWDGGTSAMGLQASWTAVVAPYTKFAIFRYTTLTANVDRVFSGLDLSHRSELYCFNSTPPGTLTIFPNGALTFLSDATNWHLVIAEFGTTGCRCWQDGILQTTYDATTSSTCNGATLGNLGGSTTSTMKGYIAEHGIITGLVTNWQDMLVSYSRTAYGSL